MKLREAIESLKQGKKVRRRAWESNLFLQIKLDAENNLRVMCLRLDSVPFSYDLDIILCDDWMIKDGDNSHLSFDEALIALQNRKKVKLSSWINDYLEMDIFSKEVIMKTLREYNFVPLFSCFQSEDWEVID